LSDFSAVTKIALIIEYDGTGYHGFQWQTGQPTVQAELEKAIGKLTGEELRVVAASRTDAGVHAKGQVVSFRTKSTLSEAILVKGLNFYLPADIAVKVAYRIADSFNIQRAAVSREYHYYLLNQPTRSPLKRGYTHHVSGQLDLGLMNGGFQVLLGKHDFASFASRTAGTVIKSTVREVYRVGIERKDDLIIFDMVASSFLPHQLRNTIGALIKIGREKMSIEEFRSIMEAKKQGLAGPTAPACGLCLMRVNYPVPLGGERNENL
jgi:tRNA pseudouridine38-40 synthase